MLSINSLDSASMQIFGVCYFYVFDNSFWGFEWRSIHSVWLLGNRGREEKGVRIFSKLFWILGMEDLPPLSNVLGLGLI